MESVMRPVETTVSDIIGEDFETTCPGCGLIFEDTFRDLLEMEQGYQQCNICGSSFMAVTKVVVEARICLLCGPNDE